MISQSFVMRLLSAGAIAGAFLSGSALATQVPFTENFTFDSASWRDTTGTLPLDWVSAGGPDGSSFASGPLNFVSLPANSTPAFARAQDEFNSSGNAFVGNWITDGVSQFSVYVRHDAPQPLTFFTRFAGPANFPGVAALDITLVPGDTWTQLIVPIVPGNPQFQFEGPASTFSSVFGNVGHVQLGVIVPSGLSGIDQVYQFDVDQAQIVPEPGAMALLAGGGLVAAWGRRRGARR
jgi:hypothetical protein